LRVSRCGAGSAFPGLSPMVTIGSFAVEEKAGRSGRSNGLGEAARGVSDKVRTAHPEVPWRVITDTRNRVSHGYFDIDLDVVWNTVTRDLPKLQESVTRILAELDSEAEDSR